MSSAETQSLINKAKVIVRQIANEAIVTNPRGSFIGRSGAYTRLPNTLAFVEIVNMLGGDILSENQTILDQMNRWIISQKKSDGSWGSTADTLAVIRTITTTERISGNVRNTDLIASLSLDTQLIGKKSIGSGNVLETFTKSLSLDTLKDSSDIHFEKIGSGRLYYDIALEYILRASGQKSRDEGFSLESGYYDYHQYQTIEKAKNKEWSQYNEGKMLYTDLKYPKEVIEYLKPLTSLKVGALVVAYNRMILAEPRDQIAFEGFIPSGAELVNPNLKTESQDVTNNASSYSLFEHEEWQDDRYFATTSSLDAGIYTFHYIFRPTHSGTYELRPSRVSEFYHPEVFGRTAGRSLVIEK